MPTIPIYQMNSFSRSGETLLLRNLNAHPQIKVVHQIHEPDLEEDMELFRFLQTFKEQSIDSDHPKVQHKELSSGQILLLKNAVWTHPHAWRGFVLARNPFSVINSCRVSSEDEAAKKHHRNQAIRWCKGIDPKLLPAVSTMGNFDAFSVLWSAKMYSNFCSGAPVIHYERFVKNPETYLRKIVSFLGLEWAPEVLGAHEIYAEGELGHGKIKLWKPVHDGSLHSYLESLSKEQMARIHGICGPVMSLYGYKMSPDHRITL